MGKVRKAKIFVYNYFEKRSIKKYSRYYIEKLVRKNNDYNTDNIKTLIEDIRVYYENKDIDELYYEKKKLKLQINSFEKLDLISYCKTLLSIFIPFILGVNTALLSRESVDQLKLLKNFKGSFIILCCVVLATFSVDSFLNDKSSKRFNILCLEILEEVRKNKIDEQK